MDILSRYDRDSRLFAFALALSLGCHLLFVFFFPGIEASASIPAVERPECSITVIVPEEKEAELAFTPQALDEVPAPEPRADDALSTIEEQQAPSAFLEPPAPMPAPSEELTGRQAEPFPATTNEVPPASRSPEPAPVAVVAPLVQEPTVVTVARREPVATVPAMGREPAGAGAAPHVSNERLPVDERPVSAAAPGLAGSVAAAATSPGAALAGLLPVRAAGTSSEFLAYRDRVGKLLRDDVERRFRRLAGREDEGAVRFKITVDGRGRATLGELSGASPLLEQLVRAALDAARLPAPPAAAGAVQLAYRFRFELR